MRKTAHYSTKTEAAIPVSDLARLCEDWIMDGQIRQLSGNTLANRRVFTGKLLWFLRQREFTACGTSELRALLAYLSSGHESEEGRWGNPRLKKCARPSTVQTYFRHFSALFQFIIEEGYLEASPMESLRPPIVRSDQVQPFTPDQTAGLLAAARRSNHPRRDTALLLFLLDTGARASEVCKLKVKDLDMQGRKCIVHGKGDKTRSLYFGRDTTKALWNLLKEEPREPDEHLFTGDRGERSGDPLTRSGVLQLINRLGKAAKVEACRCSPHTFRHTFAIEFLRGGGNVFTLQQMLGHTTLAMTNRYVALAQADIENQHRAYSPVDRMQKR